MSRRQVSYRLITGIALLVSAAFGAGYWFGQRGEKEDTKSRPFAAIAGADAEKLSGKGTPRSASPAAQQIAGSKPDGGMLNAREMSVAVTRACALGSDVKIEAELFRLVARLTPENAAAFVAELTKAKDQPYGRPSKAVWNAVWRQWGRADGKAAMDYLFANAVGRSDADVVQAMEGWQASNAAAAKEWLSIPQKPNGLWNMAWAVWQTNAGNPTLAVATERVLAPGITPEQRTAGFKHLTDRALLEGGADGITAWLNSVPPGLQKEASPHVSWRLVRGDPQAAVNWMTANARQPWRDDRHCGLLIEQIFNDDPAGTAAWAASLYPSPPDTPLEQNPVYLAARQWITTNPGAARAWIEQNPNAPWAEAARAGIQSRVTEHQRAPAGNPPMNPP